MLFVLPSHTSHLLQPLDVAVFGPFKTFYNSECNLFIRRDIGQTINRFNMCDIAYKAYSKAIPPIFKLLLEKRTFIYSVKPLSYMLYPSEGFRDKEPLKKVVALKRGKKAVEKFLH